MCVFYITVTSKLNGSESILKVVLVKLGISCACFSLLLCWYIAVMVCKHFCFKRGQQAAHETFLCAFCFKPGCLKWKNAGLGHQLLLKLSVLKIKLGCVAQRVGTVAVMVDGKVVVLAGVSPQTSRCCPCLLT